MKLFDFLTGIAGNMSYNSQFAESRDETIEVPVELRESYIVTTVNLRKVEMKLPGLVFIKKVILVLQQSICGK